MNSSNSKSERPAEGNSAASKGRPSGWGGRFCCVAKMARPGCGAIEKGREAENCGTENWSLKGKYGAVDEVANGVPVFCSGNAVEGVAGGTFLVARSWGTPLNVGSPL